jgi:hypothetical protein
MEFKNNNSCRWSKRYACRWYEISFLNYVKNVFLDLLIQSGTLYDFSAYAPSLKNEMGLSQTQINLVGIFGNLGL